MTIQSNARKALWPALALIGLWTSLPTQAGEFIVAGTGSMSIPSGDMKEFTDQTSFSGGSIDLRHLRWSSVSWGVYVGLNVFNMRSNDPTKIGDITIGGGDQYRWANAVPFHLTGHWYPIKSPNGLTFFVGGGVGATRAIRRVDVAWNRTQEDTWHASGAPEIGMLLPVTSEWKLMARVQYHYALDQGDHWGPRYVSFGLGFAEY